MRAFVALGVSDQMLDSLVEFQTELSRTGADMKLVERQNLHFTVKFLGEISEAQAADVRSRLGSLALKRVQVDVKGAGAFPSLSNPRVVWAGVAAEHEPLIGPIARQVIDSLRGIGETDSRPFQAHITVARVRSDRNVRQLAELLRANSGRRFGSVALSELKFKSSVLTGSGPAYSDIGAYRLG